MSSLKKSAYTDEEADKTTRLVIKLEDELGDILVSKIREATAIEPIQNEGHTAAMVATTLLAHIIKDNTPEEHRMAALTGMLELLFNMLDFRSQIMTGHGKMPDGIMMSEALAPNDGTLN